MADDPYAENAVQRPTGGVRNVVAGDAWGALVQAGEVGDVHIHLPPAPVPPRDLPPPPLRFVNRVRELRLLDELAAGADQPAVVVVTGMHGVGKTATALHWANRRASRFDCCLYADLSVRRHGPGVHVSEVVGDLLCDLGVPADALPAQFSQRVKLYRRMTAPKRVLVFIDDAEYAAQVEPLVPPGPGSVVIVTANRRVEELLAIGAGSVAVDPFDEPASLALLAGVSRRPGGEVSGGPGSVLVRLCGGLPAALAICAGRLAANPAVPVSELVDAITSARDPVAAVSGADGFDLSGVFDFAYSRLEPRQQIVYCRVGLHPGRVFPVGAVASLVGDATGVGDVLDSLERLHLLTRSGAGRYRVHDLVAHHARSASLQHDTAAAANDAFERLVDWYYASLRRADRAVVGDRFRLDTGPAPQAELVPSFATAADSFAWYDLERHNALAVMRAAHERGLDDRVWQLAEALWPLWSNRKHFADWIDGNRLAIEAAIRLGDSDAEARFRSHLARGYAEIGRFGDADAEMAAARRLTDGSANAVLAASVLEFGGVCAMRKGDTGAALSAFRLAREGFARCGVERGVAIQEYQIGRALLAAGRPVDALEPLERALASFRRIGDGVTEARALLRLGEANQRAGRTSAALPLLSAALAMLGELDVPFEEAVAHEAMARLVGDTEPADARHHLQAAYRLYEGLGHEAAGRVAAQLEAQAG